LLESGETEPAAVVAEWPNVPVDAYWSIAGFSRRLHTIPLSPFVKKKVTFYSKMIILS
jgi:hypothetical protein